MGRSGAPLSDRVLFCFGRSTFSNSTGAQMRADHLKAAGFSNIGRAPRFGMGIRRAVALGLTAPSRRQGRTNKWCEDAIRSLLSPVIAIGSAPTAEHRIHDL